MKHLRKPIRAYETLSPLLSALLFPPWTLASFEL